MLLQLPQGSSYSEWLRYMATLWTRSSWPGLRLRRDRIELRCQAWIWSLLLSRIPRGGVSDGLPNLSFKHSSWEIAALEDNSFLVLDGIYNHQMVFFHPPYFDFGMWSWKCEAKSRSKYRLLALLETMEHIKETITLGELFTQTEPLQYQAVEFKGSVMVISGSHDL